MRTTIKTTQRGLVWRIPVLLAVASVAGLLIALIGDGVWDFLAAVLLAVPVAVVGWSIVNAKRAARTSEAIRTPPR